MLTFGEAQAELRLMLSEMEGIQARLRIVHGGLPAGTEETSTADFAAHPMGFGGLRIAIDGLVADQIAPAIRALRAALEIPEKEERS